MFQSGKKLIIFDHRLSTIFNLSHTIQFSMTSVSINYEHYRNNKPIDILLEDMIDLCSKNSTSKEKQKVNVYKINVSFLLYVHN
jgi:hypothetical protein